ncbi:molybdopterin oxidoreductase, partial [bacterium]
MSEIIQGPRHERNYWRSLQELADSEEFRQQLENEFPGGIEPPEGMSRRRFLQIMSASIAMTTLAGCRWPEEKIVPLAARPEGVEPGTPLGFATTMELGPVAMGVVATSYDGRPIKIDGNPEFALSGGATSALAQASVLDLYDPDRSHHLRDRRQTNARKSDWETFAAWAGEHFGALKGQGRGLAVLTGATSSPSQHALLAKLATIYPEARIHAHEPVCRRNEIMGTAAAFGSPSLTQLHLDKAAVIVDFDANLMQDHATALRNSRQFAAGRKPESGHMNRLYVWENSFSITGGMADHRFIVPASRVGAAVWALAAELVIGEGLPLPMNSGVSRGELSRWRGHEAAGDHIGAVARDLMHQRGHSLLVAGMRQPAEVHALVHVLNVALGNVGQTITYLPFEPPAHGTIADLTADLQAGRVQTLVILDAGNPVYSAPADLDFGAALDKAGTVIHLGEKDDATAHAASWHLPRAHYLESWGDAMAWDGTLMAVQPLIQPLYDGHTTCELLSLLVDETPRSGWQVTRDTFNGMTGGNGPAPAEGVDRGFDKKWRRFLHDGFLAGSGHERGRALSLAAARIAPPTDAGPDAGNLEISFAHDQSVWDGRFTDNAWLQEMPDFMTKLTWDNAALVGPSTADELGVRHGDVVELELDGRKVEAPVYVLPGQARHSVTVNLGYGRTDTGRVGEGSGFDAYRLRTFAAPDMALGLKVTRTGRTYPLATTQDHHAIDAVGAQEIQDRVPSLAREGTLDDYVSHPEFVDHLGLHHPPLVSLWEEKEY